MVAREMAVRIDGAARSTRLLEPTVLKRRACFVGKAPRRLVCECSAIVVVRLMSHRLVVASFIAVCLAVRAGWLVPHLEHASGPIGSDC